MSKSLTMLLDKLCPVSKDLHVSQLTLDSRKVTPGSLFVALAKQSEKRQAHLQQALQQGAAAVVLASEHALTSTEQALLDEYAVFYALIADLDQQVSEIAARFYDRPSSALTVIAVTGTNGKTSVTHYIAEALQALNMRCAVVGTLGFGRIGDLTDSGMTTPDPVSLQAMLAECAAQGFTHVAMEASSHALDQGRLNAVEIDIAVFTNLTRDHLDYHGSMAAYAASKMRLFTMVSVRAAVVNVDDETGQQIAATLDSNKQLLAYSLQHNQSAAIVAEQVAPQHAGINFELSVGGQRTMIQSSLLGRFNVANLLATAGVLAAMNIETAKIVSALGQCHSVMGRMQASGGGSLPTVVVDYAHTPDALEQALAALRWHAQYHADLWCVFGCGGDRDQGKRAEMGAVAEQKADRLVLTDDNPRSEPSQKIIDDILRGCRQPEQVHIESDRAKAIEFALQNAQQQDIVLVAGKGHESTQEISGVKYPFSDLQIVSQILHKLAQDPTREQML